MSFGLISDNEPANGMPSNTTNGSLLALSERVPRTRICMEAPGLEEVCDISTPATRPCKADEMLPVCTARRSSPRIEEIEPVTSERFAVP